MGKQHPVFEPEAVSVFAALAAIDTARASRLLTGALKKHGGHESLGGDIPTKTGTRSPGSGARPSQT
jgi:predicted NAD/FAD-binding protein